MMPKGGPCHNCTERFTACSDKCPKDARGEFGYKAWKEEYKKLQAAEKEYLMRRREDWLRSEEKNAYVEKYASSKNKMKEGRIYGRK